MEFTKTLFELLAGLPFTSDNLANIIAGAFFAILGLSLNYLIKVKKGIKNSEKSPNKFSLKYFYNLNIVSYQNKKKLSLFKASTLLLN